MQEFAGLTIQDVKAKIPFFGLAFAFRDLTFLRIF